MPQWARWLFPLIAAAALGQATVVAVDPTNSIPMRGRHARSLLHGAHAAEDTPEEFLDHIAADGKDPSTYLLSILRGNSTIAGSVDAGQLSSLIWYIKSHMCVPPVLQPVP